MPTTRNQSKRSTDQSSSAVIAGENANASAHTEELESERAEPVKKKARRSQGSVKKAKGGSTRKKDLSRLPELPLDILFEIFLLLSPKDLLNMAVANKDYRRALVSDGMSALWKRKREESQAPQPPPGFSEAKWVAFLLNTWCNKCGVAGVSTDFYIMRRACIACRKAHMDTVKAFQEELPESEHDMLRHVLFSEYAPHSGGYRGSTKYLWRQDVLDMRKEWNTMLDDVKSGKAGAQERLKKFEEDRAEYILQVHKIAKLCLRWVDLMQLEKRKAVKEKKAMRKQAIEDRFVQLGYFPQEIQPVFQITPHRDLFEGSPNMTEKTFAKIRRLLESDIQEERLRLKQRARFVRKDKLLDLWYTWRNSLTSVPTAELLAYPRGSDIACLPEFAPIRDRNPAWLTLTDADFQPIVNDFPNIAQRFMAQKKRDYRAMVPRSNISEHTADPLELATSAFRPPPEYRLCEDDEVFVGWKTLSTKHYASYSVEQGARIREQRSVLCQFDQTMSDTARMLVKDTCGLDPYTTTVEDMDKLDERFYCKLCQNVGELVSLIVRESWVEGFSWRAALSHSLSHENEDDEDEGGLVAFGLLSEIDPNARELLDLEHSKCKTLLVHTQELPFWFCNHCLPGETTVPWPPGCRSHGNLMALGQTKRHLRDKHGIAEPKEEEDYILNEGARANLECAHTIRLDGGPGDDEDDSDSDSDDWEDSDDDSSDVEGYLAALHDLWHGFLN